MDLANDFLFMNAFPDFRASFFNLDEYNNKFEKKNVLIHASAKDVSYPEHWGPLSIKCVLNGIENYECSSRFYSVDKDHYLVFNDGQYYSSYIHSNTETESFTINFSNKFFQETLQSLGTGFDGSGVNKHFEFIEKLYTYDSITASLIKELYRISIVSNPDAYATTEIYYSLLENLLLQQLQLKGEIKKVKAIKYSTQLELYKRLNYAKDFIYSCYMKEISLNDLAHVTCMNNAYFLREFKKYFGLTPHQYIMQHRLLIAKKLLETTSNNISEICFEIGYSDVTSFSKLFKKYFNSTPAEFRSNKLKKSIFTC